MTAAPTVAPKRVLGVADLERPTRPSAAADVTRRNLRAVKATIFGLKGGRLQKRADGKPAEPAPSGSGTSSGKTQAVEVDPFARLERSGAIIRPPFDPLLLAVMPENSTELGPAIDAMAVNCEAFGWRLEPRIPVSEDTPIDVLRTLAEEQATAENFFEGVDGSFADLRDRCRRDFESGGNFFAEFVERPGSGELDSIQHLPAWTMRLGRLDQEFTEFEDRRVHRSVRLVESESELESSEVDEVDPTVELRKRAGVRAEVSYELRTETRFKRFRRYVQKQQGLVTWFKELGDPRLIDRRNGEVVGRGKLTEAHGDGATEEPRFTLSAERIVIEPGVVGFPVRWSANPVKHLALYSTRSAYGLPRYVGNLFSIFGSRAADESNYVTFKNQNVPNLAITISNGQLTDETGDRIAEFLEEIQSDDNYSKVLVLEAEPVMEGMRDPGAVKIEIVPLSKEQHTDAMFVNYQGNNDERTRRAWRFPPVFVGVSDDFTGKTIDASRKLGDEQVFGPERARFDRFWTTYVLLRLGIVWSTFRAHSPNVTENADLVRMLAQSEKTGGMTPRIARKVIGRVMNEDLGEVDPEILDPDAPMTLTLARMMKSTSASDAPGGGEPTSQGRAGLQVGDSERDRDAEGGSFEEDDVDRLRAALRAEAALRFGGFVPEAFFPDEEYSEDD